MEFKSFLETSKFLVFSLNETRLPKNYIRSSFDIEGYCFFPFDRKNRTGGGSCYYVRNDCNVQPYTYKTIFPKWVEVNIIYLTIPHCKPTLIVNVYNPPDTNKIQFINSLNNLFIELSKFKGNLLVLGDFNFDWTDNSNNTLLLKSLARQFNLTQLIKQPTRITCTTSTLLDHIYTNDLTRTFTAGTFSITNSDHLATFAVRMKKSPSIPSKIINFRNLDNVNWEAVEIGLKKFDTSSLMSSCAEPEERLMLFINWVLKIIDLHAPPRKRRVKGFKSPWMNKDLMALLIQKNGKRCLFNKERTESRRKEYRKFSNYVQNKLNKVKRRYYSEKCKAAFTAAHIWNVYKELVNIRKKRTESINSLIIDKVEIFDKSIMCDALSQDFAQPGIDNSSKILELMSRLKIRGMGSIAHEVNIVSSFRSQKRSNNISGIDYDFISRTIETLASPLKILYDGFIAEGKLPGSFNCALVTPIYKKKGSITDPSNYRPISILPLFSKILEKIIFIQLSSFIELENILDNEQHGFRRKRSCFTAATLFAHDIIFQLDKPHMKCAAVFVDLRKAFDSISSIKLLEKLFELEIDPRILQYLCAFFYKQNVQN